MIRLLLSLIFSLTLAMAASAALKPDCSGDWSEDWNDCEGSYTYDNGETYTGEWKNGEIHGFGIYRFDNGDSYEGYWRDTQQHGLGAYWYASGDVFFVDWVEGRFDGVGLYVRANGASMFRRFAPGETFDPRTPVMDALPVVRESYMALGFGGRRALQQTMKDKNIYEGSIDGRWSRDTMIAFGLTGLYTVLSFDFDDPNVVERLFAAYDETAGISTTGASCDQSPEACNTADELCQRATRFSQGQLIWRTQDPGAAYAAEAARRGLGCGVATGDRTVNADPGRIPPSLKAAGSGTGFYVTEQAHIVTNAHVIEGCDELRVQIGANAIKAEILASDPVNDLALLQIDAKPISVFSLAGQNAELLQEIFVAGFPLGDSFSSTVKVTKGIVSSVSGIANNYSLMQIDAAVMPGNSGGPILDENGNVVGVTVAKLDRDWAMENFGTLPENTNFGIKISALMSFLSANNVATQPASEEVLTGPELGRRITDATLYLTCWEKR